MELLSLLLGEAHTSNSTPCQIGVLMLLSFVEDSRVIIKVAPDLSRSVTRSASSRFRSLGIAEFPAGCWPRLRFSRRFRSFLLQELLALASADADSRAQQSVVPHLHEPLRQHVLQESPHEL